MRKRELTIIFHGFFDRLGTQDIVVMIFGMKLVITGTFPIGRCWGGERARRV